MAPTSNEKVDYINNLAIHKIQSGGAKTGEKVKK